jgi:hypothetical protein
VEHNLAFRAVALPTSDARVLLEAVRKSILAASLTLRCAEVGKVDQRLAALVADECDESLRVLGQLLGSRKAGVP